MLIPLMLLLFIVEVCRLRFDSVGIITSEASCRLALLTVPFALNCCIRFSNSCMSCFGKEELLMLPLVFLLSKFPTMVFDTEVELILTFEEELIGLALFGGGLLLEVVVVEKLMAFNSSLSCSKTSVLLLSLF